MKPFDLEAAKNGAPVCTRDGRKARIVCFDREVTNHEIIAILDDNGKSIKSYGLDGLWDKDNLSPNDLMMYEKPEPQFKPFDRVLVRDSKAGGWCADFFSHMREEEDANFPYRCIGGNWRYCLPYEGNEYLLGTADNPKED